LPVVCPELGREAIGFLLNAVGALVIASVA
jgi:hypothetical protein